MEMKKVFLYGALAVVGYLSLKSVFGSDADMQFSDGSSGGGGAMEPSAGTTNIYIGAPSLAGSSDLTAQASSFKSTNQKLAEVNRALAQKSGADGGYSTSFGEVYTKGGSIIGGTNVQTGQSLSAQGVAQAQNSFANLAKQVTSTPTKKEQKAQASLVNR